MSVLPVRTAILCVTLLIALSSGAIGQSIQGVVLSDDSVAIPNAFVAIPAINLTMQTDNTGRFVTGILSPGDYTLHIHRLGFDTAAVHIALGKEGWSGTIILSSMPLQLHAVTVTARPHKATINDIPQEVTTLDQPALSVASSPTVMGLAENVPGVAATRSGPFSVKPAIRGLGFQRVVVLEQGERHETQQWDDDDSPALDAASIDRIEIVRGPGSLLYGPDAIGGVINFLTDEPAGSVDSIGLHGSMLLQGFSGTRQGAAHLHLRGGFAASSFGIDVGARSAGDQYTPAGDLPNTDAIEFSAAASLQTRVTSGTFRTEYSHFAQHRAILAIPDSSGYERPYQYTVHDRLMIKYESPPSNFQTVISGTYQKNDVGEFEDVNSADPRVHLVLNTFALNGKVLYGSMNDFSLTTGSEIRYQSNSTIGPEPLIPGFRQTTLAGFLLSEFRYHSLNFSIGTRIDHRELSTDDNPTLDLARQKRSFGAVTGSAGLLWHATDAFSLGLNASRGWRSPTVDELFINGLEEGSLRYKEGNPDLLPEESISTDFLARLRTSGIDAELALFRAQISRYIYLAPTGTIDSASGYERFRQEQASAVTEGIDCTIRGRVSTPFFIVASASFLAGRNEDRGTWLPLLPANTISFGTEFQSPDLAGVKSPVVRLTLRGTFDQNKVDPIETPTPGYLLVDAALTGETCIAGHACSLGSTIRNLFNRRYHNHLSLFKQYAYDPGIDILLNVRIYFGKGE